MAACGARAAAGDTCRRIYQCRFSPELHAAIEGFSQRAGRSRLGRWPKYENRIPLGRRPKQRLELLHELLPKARVMALLVDPTDPTNAKTTVSEVTAAAKTFGLQLHVLNASNENDFAGVFAKLIQLGASGLVVGGGAFFVSHEEQLAALTVRHAVPAASEHREFAAAGGLLSYGTDITDAYRLTGIYTGRILRGDKPAELPVQRATKVELYINLNTAKALGLSVPPALQARADGMIE